MAGPVELAQEICDGTRGVNWDAERVNVAVKELVKARTAPGAELSKAFDLLLTRLEQSKAADNDGVAHVAITAGTLVEYGQPPERLGKALIARLPDVLRGARRCADHCLAALPKFESEEDEEKYFEPLWDEAIVQVDDKPITGAMIRAALEQDRISATALAYLEQWTLPTVAAISRSSILRAHVSQHRELLELTARLRRSTAGWLYDLFRTELDAAWLVLCPLQNRGFMLRIDGASSNFNLHEIVADLLIRQGIPGKANPPEVIAYLRGELERPPVHSVAGSFNFYDYRAVKANLAEPTGVDTAYWVWNEGSTSDIPALRGEKVLIAGPAAYQRGWNLGRPFSALPVVAKLEGELSASEVRAKLDYLANVVL